MDSMTPLARRAILFHLEEKLEAELAASLTAASLEVQRLEFPVLRQHGGHREQAEGRQGGLPAQEGKRVAHAPVGGRHFRIDQQSPDAQKVLPSFGWH